MKENLKARTLNFVTITQMTWRFATCFLAVACTCEIFLFAFVCLPN